MKFQTFLFSVFLLFVLTACSTVKLIDSSFTIDNHTLKGKKMLVIARSEDLSVRKAYEDELVAKLKSQGFNAVAAYELFPELKDKRNPSSEEIETIISAFKQKGVESVLLTSLRNTKILRENPIENNVKEAYSNTQKGRYGVSFVDYYNVNSIDYLTSSLRPVDRNEAPEVYDSFLQSTVYTLEAVVYDFSLPKSSQLAGVYEVEVTDPKSAKQVLKRFTSIVSKAIE